MLPTRLLDPLMVQEADEQLLNSSKTFLATNNQLHSSRDSGYWESSAAANGGRHMISSSSESVSAVVEPLMVSPHSTGSSSSVSSSLSSLSKSCQRARRQLQSRSPNLFPSPPPASSASPGISSRTEHTIYGYEKETVPLRSRSTSNNLSPLALCLERVVTELKLPASVVTEDVSEHLYEEIDDRWVAGHQETPPPLPHRIYSNTLPYKRRNGKSADRPTTWYRVDNASTGIPPVSPEHRSGSGIWTEVSSRLRRLRLSSRLPARKSATSTTELPDCIGVNPRVGGMEMAANDLSLQDTSISTISDLEKLSRKSMERMRREAKLIDESEVSIKEEDESCPFEKYKEIRRYVTHSSPRTMNSFQLNVTRSTIV